MLMLGFFTGMRVGSICGLRVGTLQAATPDPLSAGMWRLAIGPEASPPVPTKFGITGQPIIPELLLEHLLDYSLAPRRLDRADRCVDGLRDLLFYTRAGNAYAERDANKSPAINVEVHRLRAAATQSGIPVASFKFHDTRATFGTILADISIKHGNAQNAVGIVKSLLLQKDERSALQYIRFAQKTPIKEALANQFSREFLAPLASAIHGSKAAVPDLTFPDVSYGSIETPYDLRWFLYKGGASVIRRYVNREIESGSLGKPIMARLPFLVRLHETLHEKVAKGGSKLTLHGSIQKLGEFYRFMDSQNHNPSLESAEKDFKRWITYRKREAFAGRLSEDAVYENAYKLATLFGQSLGLSSRSLMRASALTKPQKDKSALGTEADKQNLQETMEFGAFLLDITQQLNDESIFGSIPAVMKFRNGRSYEHYSGALDNEMLKRVANHPALLDRTTRIREQPTKANRAPLINVRVKAELLIFISQTGMNLAQATSMRFGKFTYQSHLDGYQVRRMYKSRKGGDVEFEIFSEYRPHFDSYLKWRGSHFPTSKSSLLFPLMKVNGKTVQTVSPFASIRRIAKETGYTYYGPKSLRSTRVNWLLRRSSDPSLTAEMAQHALGTLLHTYQQPHHQRAAVEITTFWQLSDPILMAAGPGGCESRQMAPIEDLPEDAPKPDCMTPSGCLFCKSHRDIDSEDHLWSLASLRYLKTLEEARGTPLNIDTAMARAPATAVIHRITEKLKAFESSSRVRASWVSEVVAKIAEGDYHPRWRGFIEMAEILR
ncbi:MAG: hypothetical protein NVV67_03490 [Pseudoxanthomonas sp.]|nr:hypothetical protein [Pseudoxanthomonas sp.]